MKIPYIAIQIVVPLVLLVGTVLASLPYAASRRASYEASARIWVQANIPNTGSGDRSEEGNVYLPFMSFFNNPLLTAAEILKSGEVVNQAGILLSERFPGRRVPGASEIANGISSVPIRETDILLVKYSGSSPKQAADTLEAVLDAFVQISSRQSSASATKGRAFLEQQMVTVQSDLEKASDELETFQKQHNVANIQTDIANLLARIEDTKRKLQDGEITITKMRDEIPALEREYSSAPEPNSAQGELVQKLDAELASAKMQLENASEKLTPDHPYVDSLKQSVAYLERQLAKTPRPTATPSAGKASLGPQIMERKRELAQVEIEYRANMEYMGELQAKLKKLPRDQIEWVELTRRKDIARLRVEELERKLQSANLLEIIASGTTNIKIIDRPTVPRLPNGPSKMLTIGIAGIVGTILAVAAFLVLRQFNPNITEAKQVLSILSWPLAGAIGYGAKARQSQAERIRRAVKRNLGDLKRIVIVSPSNNEGKSQLAASLAMAFAQTGSRVVLVDAAKGGALHARFNTTASPGLSDYVLAPTTVNPVKKVAENLLLLPAGSQTLFDDFITENPARDLFDTLEKQTDVLIFDTSGTIDDQTAIGLLENGGFALALARMGNTSKNGLNSLARQLNDINDLVGMIVITGANEEDLALAITTTAVKTEGPAPPQEEQPVW